MSTPKPGQIRCPTCHRSTAPAAFCTHCGAPIPSSSVTRPRGLDRDELDSRIRGRRTDTPFRRGGYADEAASGGYAPFEPEPEDALAKRPEPDGGQRQYVDNVRDEAPAAPPPAAADPWRRGREVPPPVEPEPQPELEEEPAPPGSLVPPLPPLDLEPPPTVDAEPVAPAQPDPWAARAVEPPPPAEAPHYGAVEDYGTGDDDEGWPAEEPYYVPADDYDDRRGRSSVLPIVGFVALGVIALLMGVFFSNLFGDDEPVARQTASPTAAASSAAPTPSETAAASASAGESTSGQPNASEGPPITFPDGFVATTQPCVSQPNESGCNSDGATNSGSIWVYIDFEQGQREDVLGMTILDSADAVVAQASIELAQVNCPPEVACNGWVLFPGFGTPFTDLEAGDYRIRINRNGLPAAEADFTVT